MSSFIDAIFSFIASFIISALIIALVGVFYLLMTFDLAGGETLGVIEANNIVQFIIALFLLVLAVWFARTSFRKERRYTAYGAIVLPALVFIAASIYLIDQNFNYTQFNKSTWQHSNLKPEKMAKSLVRERMLIGLTKQQVRGIMGAGNGDHEDDNSDSGAIEYSVENNWTLTIIFEQNKVVETKLRQPFLGV